MLKDKDLILTNEGEVYNRAMNNSVSQGPFQEDNTESISSRNSNNVPHPAPTVNGEKRFLITSNTEAIKNAVAEVAEFADRREDLAHYSRTYTYYELSTLSGKLFKGHSFLISDIKS